MGHGRGQPDRLPLARPLARSLAHARGTGHPPGGKGTRYESHARGPTPGPASTRLAPPPHPTPPRPHPLKRGGGAGGGRQKGTQTGGGTGKHEPAGTGTGGRGGARQGKAHNDDQAERPHRPGGTHAPRRGGQAQEEEGGRRGSNEKKNPAVAPRPPGAPLPPPLSLHAASRACAAKTPHDRRVAGSRAPNPLERHQNPAGSGARGTARPQPGGKRAAAEGHRGVPRATTGARIPGARPRARHGLGASRPPRQGEALFGGARGAEGTPGGAADRGREPAGHRRHRRRRVGGARQTGGGGGPDSTPRPISRGLPAARRGDSARRPHPTPGETHHAQKTACGARRLPKGRRRPRPTASARALWSVSSLSRAARAPPRPRSRRRPPPANPPHRPTRAPSSERAAGAGRGGGVGCGADTAGGRGGAPVSALRGTKGTRRPCEDTPAAPPPERETPRGWRLIVKRRSDRRSPGRNPGPQVRSKCR